VRELAASELDKGPNERLGDGSPNVLFHAADAIRALLPSQEAATGGEFCIHHGTYRCTSSHDAAPPAAQPSRARIRRETLDEVERELERHQFYVANTKACTWYAVKGVLDRLRRNNKETP
jgi:hypothetical protein